MRMFQVDAFTNELFRGNPAAVLVLEEPLSEETMQAIASENNLSETAFAEPIDDGWTPALVHAGERSWILRPRDARDRTRSGDRVRRGQGDLHFRNAASVRSAYVRQEGDGYRLDLPAFPPGTALPRCRQNSKASSRSHRRRSSATSRTSSQSSPTSTSRAAVRTRTSRRSPVCTRWGSSSPREARVSTSSPATSLRARGFPEDPVTGSTHATLVPFWSELCSGN